MRRPTARDAKRTVGRGLVPDLARERKICKQPAAVVAGCSHTDFEGDRLIPPSSGLHGLPRRAPTPLAAVGRYGARLSILPTRVAFRSVVMAAPLRTGRGRVHLRPRLQTCHTVSKACRILYAARCRRAPTRWFANQRRRNRRLRGQSPWSLRELRRRMCAARTRRRRLPIGFDRSKVARRSGRTCRTCDRCAESGLPRTYPVRAGQPLCRTVV